MSKLSTRLLKIIFQQSARYVMPLWIVALLAGWFSGAALGQTMEAQTPASDSMLTPEAVEQWADEVFGQALAEHRFSALGIAVTHGDRVLLTKGYGYHDWAARTPVQPDKSQFRIASVTKTFVATATAQLLERGLIQSLDDPVNKYLKRTRLDQSFGREITIWDLLTHRAGYETRSHDSENREVPVPREVIVQQTPKIVRARDTLSVYSNFSVAMLGIMVEDIVGTNLQEYLQTNIFGPTGMTHTQLGYAATQPPDLVNAYGFVPDTAPILIPFGPRPPFTAPAGAINTTPADMAKYLIAHIEAGRGGEPSILKPATFDLMKTRHAGNHPDTSGFGMMFMIYDWNGEPVVEHYGSLGFRALLLMMPVQKIGVMIMVAGGAPPRGSIDTKTGAGASEMAPITGPVKGELGQSGIRDAVLNHFLGRLRVPAMPPLADVSKYVGEYWSTGRNYSSVAVLANTLSPRPRTVTATADGALTIGGLGPFLASGANTFTLDRPVPLDAAFETSGRYVFTTDGTGNADTMLAYVNAGSFQKRSGLDNPFTVRMLLYVALALCATGVIAVVWRAPSPWSRVAKLSTAGIGVCVIAGVAYGALTGSVFRIDERILPVIVLANLAAMLAILSLIAALRLWMSRVDSPDCGGSRAARVHYIFAAAAGIFLIFMLAQVNLLGYRMQ